MKQGDYVKWIFGPNDERVIAKGIILKKVGTIPKSDDRYKVLFRSGSIQYLKKTELRIIQEAE